jgi:hypothetical protein
VARPEGLGRHVPSERANGVSLLDAGPGNYMYGQGFWQNTQEGVVEETYRGRRS